ncbi:FIST N-terminal domain-containing protein, partial [Geobacillus sp. CAMR5420]|uniref:FIST N-terminal domain-containing protein n=1 Tax=Geobacillus sp. CAMR5420 TaxID=1482739 RepID=UPI00049F590A
MRWFCCRRAEELDHLLREHSSSLDEPLFVQIAGNDEAAVRHAAAALARRWPHAHMVGMAGPLPMAGEANLAVGVASMTSSTVSSLALPADEFDRPDGLAALIAEAVVRHDTTLLLLFTNHRSALPPLLRRLPLANERMVIIGCALPEGSVLFSPDGRLERGGIAVSFSGTALRGHCMAPFLWEPVGRSFSITKSSGQQIDELDGQKPSWYLERYLGKEFMDRLPLSGVEFPFLIERNGRDVCLPIVALHSDGSVAVRGHVHDGEKVRFSYVHAPSLYWSARDAAMHAAKQSAEGMFFYYSAALSGYTRPLFDGVMSAFGQAAFFPAVEVFVKDAHTATAVWTAAFAAVSLTETAASAENSLSSPLPAPPEV